MIMDGAGGGPGAWLTQCAIAAAACKAMVATRETTIAIICCIPDRVPPVKAIVALTAFEAVRSALTVLELPLIVAERMIAPSVLMLLIVSPVSAIVAAFAADTIRELETVSAVKATVPLTTFPMMRTALMASEEIGRASCRERV